MFTFTEEIVNGKLHFFCAATDAQGQEVFSGKYLEKVVETIQKVFSRN